MFKRTIAGVNFSSTLMSFIVIAVLAALVIVSSSMDMRRAQTDSQLMDVIAALDNVAHNFAVERGLTAGFLVSRKSEAKAKVDAQREVADRMQQSLLSIIASSDDNLIRAYTLAVVEQFKSLDSVRGFVDQGQRGGFFAYYSQLNRLSLDSMASLARALSNDDIKAKINTVIQLAWYKERAGQVRGRLNGVLASRALSDDAKADVLFYQRELATLKQYALQQADAEDRVIVKGVVDSDTSGEVANIIDRVLSGSESFDRLPTSADWFALASKHIGEVKGAINKEWQVLQEKTAEMQSTAFFYLILTVGLIVVAIVLLAMLNLWLRKLLQKDMPVFITKLETMANDYNLSLDVGMEGDNEVARISRAVHRVVDTMREALSKMQRVVDTTQQVNIQLEDASQKLLDNSDNTQRMATSIAAAIEENSSTSSEIAHSATNTMESTKHIAEQTRESLAASEGASQKMAKLQDNSIHITEQSSQLTAAVDNINKTVGRINELFEQTNLLALNASIEAARAGEHGRGFAVVADEVRNLAFRSIEASDQIAEVLKTLSAITDKVSHSVHENKQLSSEAMDAMLQNRSIMQAITATLNDLESMSTSVAAATEEQYAVSQTIAQDASQVLSSANVNHETSKIVQELAVKLDHAQLELKNAYSRFNL